MVLPLAPKSRVLSEVATLSFVQENTTIPVPEVIAYDADLDNELGYEWILLKHAHGRSFADRWLELSWLQKELLVRKIADYVAQLSRLELSGIGSIFQYNLSSGNTKGVEHVVGEYIGPYFYKGEHIQLNIHRGPYQASSEWLAAHMEFMLYDIAKWRASDDDNDKELAVEVQKVYNKIQLVIQQLFPEFDSEPTFLYPHNFNDHNIIVGDSGNLICILNWSGISAGPGWASCQVPYFLDVDCVKYIPEPLNEEELNDESSVSLYQERIEDYEAWRLRAFFFEEVRRVEPKWVKTFKELTSKRDVIAAIEFAGNG